MTPTPQQLVNDLRMYADDIFSAAGSCGLATTLSQAADMLERYGKPAAVAQEPVKFGPLAKRRVFDYIRGAYDIGYNDARGASAVPGDNAPGYAGRDVEADHGSALLRALETIPQPAAVREAWRIVDALENVQQLAVPPGYKLVPVEPDKAQIKEGNKVTWPMPCEQAYRAMVNAAPDAPAAVREAIEATVRQQCEPVLRELVEALRVAILQNSCDMVLTGEEIRNAESALTAAQKLLKESK